MALKKYSEASLRCVGWWYIVRLDRTVFPDFNVVLAYTIRRTTVPAHPYCQPPLPYREYLFAMCANSDGPVCTILFISSRRIPSSIRLLLLRLLHHHLPEARGAPVVPPTASDTAPFPV